MHCGNRIVLAESIWTEIFQGVHLESPGSSFCTEYITVKMKTQLHLANQSSLQNDNTKTIQ